MSDHINVIKDEWIMAIPLKFYLVTDLHHYAKSLGTSGKAYEAWNRTEQKCLAETGAIIDAAFERILADRETNIVLIAGDVSSTGAMESHMDLLPRLRRLKDGGKDVYLITATHDYMHALRCDGDALVDATPTDRNMLREIYYDYGWNRAISEHKETFSYCVQLCAGYRLLCMNDDGDLRDWHGYTPSQTEWLLKQVKEAHEAGDYIFMMTHHPCLPPNAMYPVYSKKDMLADYEEMTSMFADHGLNLVFTGHTHMQNIAVKTTEKGNVFYDVNTGSLVGYPTAIRKVVIDDEKIDIKTEQIEDFDADRGGLSVNDFLKNHFCGFLEDIFHSAAYDIERMTQLAGGFSMTPKQICKLKVPISCVGRILQKWTLGKTGRILCVSGKIDKSVKNIVLKDLIIQILINIYHGDEPLTPDTPEYRAMEAILGRVGGVLKRFKKTRNVVPVFDVVLKALYDEAPADWDAVLPR